MSMPSSQTMNYSQLCDDIVNEIWMRSQSEVVPELRPAMPVDLFKAAIKGDSNYIDGLIRRLGVHLEEQREVRVNIEDTQSAPDEINPEIVQSELHSATHFGDTILHLLIIEGHNELALKVFECDESLLKARNNMLETPVYCAVKVGNTDVINKLMRSNDAVVKNVVTEANKNGHTAFYVAIIKGYTMMVQIMLEVDPYLACTPFSDGMFPVHVAARMGQLDLVMHFMRKYPDDAVLRDPYGRNIFHIAVEENEKEFFNFAAMFNKFKEIKGENYYWILRQWREMIERMITAKNYEGNTSFHIAAMKGNRDIMRAIWEHFEDAQKVRNNEGYTPLQLSAKEVLKNNEEIDIVMISKYLQTHNDYKFTHKWFDDFIKPPLKNKWERTQVIGLGSVLITTVAFAAAFTMPGGYNQDDGTPVLGRKYMFRAFILANALAFIQGFISLFVLLMETMKYVSESALVFATKSFVVAASSMIVAFGLGMYVTLAPVCLRIAILLLVITIILGIPPALILFVGLLKSILGRTITGICCILTFFVMSVLFIFGLAFV